MNYYEHHIGDYAEATAHLSFVEDAAYSRMIRKYYATEKPLPADVKAVQRLVGARTREERDAVQAVLEEFFTLEDDGWHQKRCDADLSRFQSKQDKARASANARWGKSQPERNADAMRTHAKDSSERNANASETHNGRNALQSPVTSHQSPVTNEKKEGDSGAAPALTPPPPDFLGEKNEGEIPTKAKVRLAEGWELPTTWGNDAEALGFTPPEILLQAEKYRQYWVSGKGADTRRTLKGWRQSWSNWLGNAERFRRGA